MEKKQTPKASGSKEAKTQKVEKKVEKNEKKALKGKIRQTSPIKPLQTNTRYSLLIQGPPLTSRLRSDPHQKERALVDKMVNCPPESFFDFIYNLFNEKGKKFLQATYPEFYKEYLRRHSRPIIRVDQEPMPIWNNLIPEDSSHFFSRFGDSFTDFFYKVFGSGFTPDFEKANSLKWKNFEAADAYFSKLLASGMTYDQAMDRAFSAYSAGEATIKSSFKVGSDGTTQYAKDVLTKLGGGGMAPVAFGGHSSPHHMDVTSHEGGIRVKGTIPMANVQNNAAGFVNWFPLIGSTTILDQNNHTIDLSVDALGNRIALFGSLYALVKYNSMKMIYTPSVSTNIGGLNIAFGYNPDPARADLGVATGFDYVDILQYQHCCTTSVWQPCELSLPVSSDWLFTAIRDVGNIAEDRQVTPGQIVVSSSTNPNLGAVFGTCRLDFDVEFAQPVVSYGLTLYKEVENKFSSDSLNFLLEHVFSDPGAFLGILKSLGYAPPSKLDPNVLNTLKAIGILPPVDARAASFLQLWESFSRT